MKENPGKATYHFQEYLRLSPNQSDATQIKSMIQLLPHQKDLINDEEYNQKKEKLLEEL